MNKLAVLLSIILLPALWSCTLVPGASGTPVITSFIASPPVITSGQTSNLTWNVNGATSVTLSPNVGTVGASGSITVTPASSTTYTLTASNGFGSSTASVTMTVNPLSSPPVISGFNVNPTVIYPGQAASLTWNVSGADMVRIDPTVGNVSPSGSQTVSPGATTTYILTAAGATGVITNTVTLSVVPTYSTSSPYPTYPVYPPNPNSSYLPSIITFSIDPPDISPGETTVMTWDVIGANSVSIDNGIGDVPPSGSLTLNPSTTTYFQLAASNSYGPVTSSAIVTVYPLNYYYYTPPPVVFPPVRTPPPEGPGETNDHDRDNSGRVPRIENFQSNPPKLDVGHPAELQWKVDGATSVHISPDIGAVPPSGKMTVAPNHTTVYTITASNSNGVVQHPQEITVPRTFDGRGPNDNTTRSGAGNH
ncbi:MAG: hypothetical protein ABSG90_00230 [Dehalococcoidia bacterium]